MKKFKILIKANATNDEIVDSISDGYGVVYEVVKSQKDGFQFADILVFIGQQPTIQEAINDFPKFAEQFLALNPDDALDAVQQSRARSVSRYGELGKYGEAFYNILEMAARSYGFGLNAYENGKGILEGWQAIFKPAKPQV